MICEERFAKVQCILDVDDHEDSWHDNGRGTRWHRPEPLPEDLTTGLLSQDEINSLLARRAPAFAIAALPPSAPEPCSVCDSTGHTTAEHVAARPLPTRDAVSAALSRAFYESPAVAEWQGPWDSLRDEDRARYTAQVAWVLPVIERWGSLKG